MYLFHGRVAGTTCNCNCELCPVILVTALSHLDMYIDTLNVLLKLGGSPVKTIKDLPQLFTEKLNTPQ